MSSLGGPTFRRKKKFWILKNFPKMKIGPKFFWWEELKGKLALILLIGIKKNVWHLRNHWHKLYFFIIYSDWLRLDRNIKWKSLNNTYLKIIEIFTKLLIIIKVLQLLQLLRERVTYFFLLLENSTFLTGYFPKNSMFLSIFAIRRYLNFIY